MSRDTVEPALAVEKRSSILIPNNIAGGLPHRGSDASP